ncbi:MAG: ABC-type transport auxiliary lipoprotein family protein [Pseudomonadota bacterium]|nr:ABC-type transport auxiliary lipoprotein family protein [Pseudomonadota bacterium]
MEFNARYFLTGLFAAAVIVAMFLFVYWLDNRDGFGDRTEYRVRFKVPVTGLATGSDVLFNGIKVGEVDAIRLDPDDPAALVATISIAEVTPVRTDTSVGIDYQGLTGAANVLLTGGSAGAPLLVSGTGLPPMLEADPGASRSWTQKASRILGRLDDVLERNEGRFDTIFAGLERLAGGGTDDRAKVTHDLLAPDSFPAPAAPFEWQLAVNEPSVVLALNTDRMLERVDGSATRPIGEARWADSLPTLFQARIVQGFENAGHPRALRPADALGADYSLLLDIRGFRLVAAPQPHGVIDIVAKLLDRDGALVATRHFTAREPATGTGEADAARALGEVFTRTANDLVGWTLATL